MTNPNRNKSPKHLVIDPLSPFGAEQIAAYPGLRAIATPSTGRDHIDLEACAAAGIAVYGLTDDREGLTEIRASSEWTFCMILLGLRRAHQFLDGMYRGERGHELYQRTVGVVGAGRIGGNVMRWCAAFGATTSFHDPYKAGHSTSLEELFAENDVVCICCSLTDETHHMIDRSLMDLMVENATLVNTSRGAILHEADLFEFLKARPDVTLAADVWEGELEGRNPLFWGLPNVVFSPHIAGFTVESNQKALQIAERLLDE